MVNDLVLWAEGLPTQMDLGGWHTFGEKGE